MTERYAAGYLRRSSADDKNPGDVSRESQSAAILRAVQRDGWTGEIRYFDDWNRSAAEEKEAKRTAYLAMLKAVADGEVELVAAAALDRLYRSSRTFWRLMDVAKAHGARIVTDRDGVLGGDGSPMATAFATISAAFTTLELDTIKRRNQDAAKARKDRGDSMGPTPYGQRIVRDDTGAAVKPIRWEDDPDRPLAPILEAYSAAGSVLGACKLLDAANVPTPKGKVDADGRPAWESTSLTLILDRARVLPPHGQRRRYAKSAYCSHLLLCHCGSNMTPDHAHVRTGTSYYCHRGKMQGVATHGRNWVREAAILPIIRAEADRLAIPFDDVELGQQDDTARDSLAERKRRLALTFADGLLEPSDYAAELAKIAESVERIEAAAEVVELPPLNWDGPVGETNTTLRSLFWPIQLAPDMTIVEILWRAPELRRG
jgi:DNA invertase Pin-like site-specific DNA recombinase